MAVNVPAALNVPESFPGSTLSRSLSRAAGGAFLLASIGIIAGSPLVGGPCCR
jgi:hypothetical protein